MTLGDTLFVILAVSGVGLLLTAALAAASDLVVTILNQTTVGSDDSSLVAATETGQALLASSRPVHTLSGPEPLSGPDECPTCGLYMNGVYRRDRFNRLVCRPCALSGDRSVEPDTVTGQWSTDCTS
jgi:hypothetical protein